MFILRAQHKRHNGTTNRSLRAGVLEVPHCSMLDILGLILPMVADNAGSTRLCLTCWASKSARNQMKIRTLRLPDFSHGTTYA